MACVENMQNFDSIGVVIICRNEGERLVRCLSSIKLHPHRVVYVDSGSTDASVEAAQQKQAFLDLHKNLAVVCGRRRERNPDASIYNRLCDLEWDTPIGETLSCGGDSL